MTDSRDGIQFHSIGGVRDSRYEPEDGQTEEWSLDPVYGWGLVPISSAKTLCPHCGKALEFSLRRK